MHQGKKASIAKWFPAFPFLVLCIALVFDSSQARGQTRSTVGGSVFTPFHPTTMAGATQPPRSSFRQRPAQTRSAQSPRMSRHPIFRPLGSGAASADDGGSLTEPVWYRAADEGNPTEPEYQNSRVGGAQSLAAGRSHQRLVNASRDAGGRLIPLGLRGGSPADTTVLAWSREFYSTEVPAWDLLWGFVTDDSGNSYVTGNSGRYSDDFLTAKYSPDGNLVWAKYYDGPDGGNDYPEDIVLDRSHNVVVAGWGWNAEAGTNDVVTVKYDADGNQQWVARYHGPAFSGAHSVRVDSAGFVYVAGASQGSINGNSDFLLLKYDAGGSLLWERRISQAGLWIEGYDVNIASSGNLIVGGYRSGTIVEMLVVACTPDGNVLWTSVTAGILNTIELDHHNRALLTGYSVEGDHDCLTIAYDTLGQELWRDRYDGVGLNDSGYDLCIDGRDNVYVTGGSFANLNRRDCLTIKYNSAGERLWLVRESGPDTAWNYGKSIAVDRYGKVAVLGEQTWPTDNDLELILYDSSGAKLGLTTYGHSGPWDDFAVKVIFDPGGDLRFAAQTDERNTYYDYLLVRVSPDGAEKWRAVYSGRGAYASPYAIAVDAQRNVYVTGDVVDTTSTHRCFLLKYDAEGNLVWAERLDGAPDDDSYAWSIAVDKTGNVFVAGEIYHPSTQTDFLVFKVDADGNELWSREFDYYGSDAAYKVAVDDSDNVIVTGAGHEYSGNSTGVTIKYTSAGDFIWMNDYTPLPFTRGVDVMIDHAGNPTVLMYLDSIVLVKYSSAGEQLWDFVNAASGWATAVGGAIDQDGNFYVTGMTGGPVGQGQCFTVKVTKDGTLAWDRRYVSPDPIRDAYGNAVAIDTARRSLYVTGQSPYLGTDFSALTIKYNFQGDELWAVQHHDPPSGASVGRYAALDSLGNVFVVGDVWAGNWSWDYLALKYDTAGICRMDDMLGRRISSIEHSRGMASAGGDLYMTGAAEIAMYGKVTDVLKFTGGIVMPWLSTTAVQLDTIDIGCSTVEMLTVKNLGTARLDVLEASSTMKGVEITPTAATISPGGEQEFLVSFTPDAPGVHNGSIVFTYGGTVPPQSASLAGYCRSTDLSVVVPLREKWNLISSPLLTRCPLRPGPKLFTYEPVYGQYVITDTVSGGRGAWLKASSAGTSLTVYGYRNSLDTIPVHAGWNIIGSISDPVAVSSLVGLPFPMATSLLWGYEGTYVNKDTISPGKGYWIKVDHDGQLVLTTGAPAGDPMLARVRLMRELPPPPPEESMIAEREIPRVFALRQSYPNPFNPTATITYDLPEDATAYLRVYNVLGEEVAVLAAGRQSAGYKTCVWDALNAPTGVYFYRLQAVSLADPGRTFTEVRKMILAR